MYSLSLTLCRCVAALREAFFGASFVAHFFIFRGKTLKRIIAVLLALSCLSACSSNAAESYVPQGTSSPSYQYTSQEEPYSQTVSHNEAHNYESSTEMVWIPTNGGIRYHTRSYCSNMKAPEYVSIDTAIEKGFTPCGNCYN